MEATISILKGNLSLSQLKQPGETTLELKLDLEPVLVEDADKESYSLLFKGSLNCISKYLNLKWYIIEYQIFH